MNAIDYLLLAALAAGALYTFYRLFAGFAVERSRDVKQADPADYSKPSDKAMADFKR